MKIVICILGAFVLYVLIVVGLLEGVKRHEALECEQWEREAKIYGGYCLVEWQIAQCKAHGIEGIVPLCEK